MTQVIALNILLVVALFFYFENNVNAKDVCPRLPLIYCFVQGPELCKNDSDCSNSQKCCIDECQGRKCMDPEKEGKCTLDFEVYKKCGTACPLTCEHPEHRSCAKQCVEGCFCETGYYRASDGVCVLYADC